MEHGINVDAIPKCFPVADGNCGTQSFTVDETQVLLEFDGQKSHVNISKPTQDNLNALSAHELTSTYPCTPESNTPPKPCRLNNKKLLVSRRQLKKITETTGVSMKEWQCSLVGTPIDVITKKKVLQLS